MPDLHLSAADRKKLEEILALRTPEPIQPEQLGEPGTRLWAETLGRYHGKTRNPSFHEQIEDTAGSKKWTVSLLRSYAKSARVKLSSAMSRDEIIDKLSPGATSRARHRQKVDRMTYYKKRPKLKTVIEQSGSKSSSGSSSRGSRRSSSGERKVQQGQQQSQEYQQRKQQKLTSSQQW